MAKTPATIYVCSNCGHQSRKWIGRCPDCGEYGTLVEEKFRPTAQVTGKSSVVANFRVGTDTKPIAYGEIESQDDARTSSGIEEFDRVLTSRYAASRDERGARLVGQREDRPALREGRAPAQSEEGVPRLRAATWRAGSSGLGARWAPRSRGRDAGTLGLRDVSGVFADAVRRARLGHDGGVAPSLDSASAELFRGRSLTVVGF